MEKVGLVCIKVAENKGFNPCRPFLCRSTNQQTTHTMKAKIIAVVILVVIAAIWAANHNWKSTPTTTTATNVIPPVAAGAAVTTVTTVATPAPVVATATPAPAPAPTVTPRKRIRVPLEPLPAGEVTIRHGKGAYEIRQKFIQPTNFIIAIKGAAGTMQAKRNFAESASRREGIRRKLLAHIDQSVIEEELTAQLASNNLKGGHVELLPAPPR